MMMEALLKINSDTCIACYACVRACPVKAIRVTTEKVKPEIIPERCIGCGSCAAACGPGAVEIRDSKEELKGFLLKDKKVIALVDPSLRVGDDEIVGISPAALVRPFPIEGLPHRPFPGERQCERSLVSLIAQLVG